MPILHCFGWVVVLAMLAAPNFGCPNEFGCRECGTDVDLVRVCNFCEKTYFDIRIKACNTVKRASSVPNCLRYVDIGDGKVGCCECDSGYFLNAESKCQKCSKPFCAKCNKEQECIACRDKRAVKDGQCDIQGSCPLGRCDVCESQSGGGSVSCVRCEKGAAKDRFGVCKDAPPNCDVLFEDDSTKCRICNPGHFITDQNTCVPGKTPMVGFSWVTLVLLLVLLIVGVLMCYRKWRIQEGRRTNIQNGSEYFVS